MSPLAQRLWELAKRKTTLTEAYEAMTQAGIRRFLSEEQKRYRPFCRVESIDYRPTRQPDATRLEQAIRWQIAKQQRIRIGRRAISIFSEELTTKKSRKSPGGSLDLLGADEKGRLFLLELKQKDNEGDTILKTILQCINYQAQISCGGYKPLLERHIDQAARHFSGADVAAGWREAASKTLKHRRRFATVALIEAGNENLEAERDRYQRLLWRARHSGNVVLVASIRKENGGEWAGAWESSAPKGW